MSFFIDLASQVADGPTKLISLHPLELTGLLEQAWNLRVHSTASPLGHPDHRSDTPGIGIEQLPRPVLAPPSLTGNPPSGTTTFPAQEFTDRLRANLNVTGGDDGTDRPAGVRWDHLIYAYMIANTRIRPIFRRVALELVQGEKFGVPGDITLRWLRNTEEVFFRDAPPFSVTNVTSHIRPNIEVTERQAYYRMFGMDLNHGNDDNSPFSYVRAEAANKEFVTTFEELLREVWVGTINRGNASGSNPTDDAKIQELTRSLNNMLIDRRRSGNLAREEFFLVAMMSWFHLTVDTNLPIIVDLRADGTSPEQRLFKIAQMVGLPAHGLSRSYFEIADAVSAVLIAIETGALGQPDAARAFYDPAVPNPAEAVATNRLPAFMNTIITHWSIITGHDIKAGKVAVR